MKSPGDAGYSGNYIIITMCLCSAGYFYYRTITETYNKRNYNLLGIPISHDGEYVMRNSRHI